MSSLKKCKILEFEKTMILIPNLEIIVMTKDHTDYHIFLNY